MRLGIDIGSTTLKYVLLNDDGEIIGAERQIDAGSATADYNIENFTYTK